MFRGQDNIGNWHYGNLHSDTITGSDKCCINSRISVDNPNFIEVQPETVGQLTDSVDMYGNKIWEGDLVNQMPILVGDDGENITGIVEFNEGHWWINGGVSAVHLWSEHRENTVL